MSWKERCGLRSMGPECELVISLRALAHALLSVNAASAKVPTQLMWSVLRYRQR